METVEATLDETSAHEAELRALRAQVAAQGATIQLLTAVTQGTARDLRSVRGDTILLWGMVVGVAWLMVSIARDHADEIESLRAALNRRAN